MKSKFSPSINIIRDQEKDLAYISTPNAERVIEQLNKNVLSGLKSFYLVGSFGTGKSSFLLALENQISRGNSIFKTKISFNGQIKYHSFNILGDYRSFEDSLREGLKIGSKKDVLNGLQEYYSKVVSQKKGLLIVIDEFGKFLEYATHNNPEKELYLIQKLAEFANDHEKNILFLTTMHQGFDFYRSSADEKTKNEWDKVRGRLKEITFNEPVEQLLHLASKFINGKVSGVTDKEFLSLYRAILTSKVYPLNNSIDEKLARSLFPLDLLAAGILTKALQKYGQNERSLFTFLETNNYSKFISTNTKYFSLNSVYDYLIDNFYSMLSSVYNRDLIKWSVLRNSIERSEILFENHSESKEKIIKTIGLLNIFAPSGAHINKEFLEIYGKLSLGIPNVREELKILESKKIIRYQEYSDSYILFEGTDVDIDLALNEAENLIDPGLDIVSELKDYFVFPFIPAKASYIKKGTPRFFEFVISEEPIIEKPSGEVDGIINIIFNESVNTNKIKKLSSENGEAILYGVYNNTKKIKATIKEIEKINFVLENNADDRVVQRELKSLKDSFITELNKLVLDNLFENNSSVTWFFGGERKSLNTRSDLNRTLSVIVDVIYSKTPIYKNELINRVKLPSAITTARKSLLKKLISNSNEENLGFAEELFPPEKTIYLSLLKATGIHRLEGNEYVFLEPKEKSFKPLWSACEKYFESSKKSKKSILDLTEILLSKPFKLKQGFIDVWLLVYLVIKKDDYALFYNDTYIPYLSDDLFDLIIRYPQEYFIKAFDIQGIKFDLFNRYRNLLDKSKAEKISNQSFIDTIRPFLTFYRSLPEYSKATKRLTPQTLALRNAIASSKDPEKTFFEDFPNSLGYSSIKLYESEKQLEKYTLQLQNCIRELRSAYNELLNRIDNRLLEIVSLENIEFPIYKEKLLTRYSSIKRYLMLPHQKTFHQRMISQLDDRTSWLSSVVNSLIGKNLENISDDEEEIIAEKLENIFREFDNLTDFANLEVNEAKEDAIRFEITPLNDTPIKTIIRVPKQKLKESASLEEDIRKKLTKDKSVNQLVLLKLFKEQLDNE